ncbi:Splicing factor 45 [Phlyctochytrium bullatum]|nr:Splicing factor 45 [Phlyctochytrium bullatum]
MSQPAPGPPRAPSPPTNDAVEDAEAEDEDEDLDGIPLALPKADDEADDEDLDGIPFAPPNVEKQEDPVDEDDDDDLNGVPLRLQRPTTVLLLKNLVGRGEVDADLQDETASECSKYGKVERCVIYEENL